jgi:carbon monoxide dehydrogenase subunit G
MPPAFTATRTVPRPADQAWATLTDWDSAAGWLGVDRIRAEGPTAVGTRLTFTARGKDRVSEISALDPGRSVTLRSVQGGVTADYRYTVEPAGDGTRLTLVADVTTRGPWRALGPVIRAAIRRSDAGQLDALAAALGS